MNLSELRVRTVVNEAADDIVEAAQLPDGTGDAINLLVNVILHRLFENNDATLAEVVEANYANADLNEVLDWIGGD